jgi:hypothetical protein
MTQRRRWTNKDVATLRSMAQKYPTALIASELGRAVSSVHMKASSLGISLRIDWRQVQIVDPGTSGMGPSQLTLGRSPFQMANSEARARWPSDGRGAPGGSLRPR